MREGDDRYLLVDEHGHAHENGREAYASGSSYVRPPSHRRGPSGGSSEGTSPLLPEGVRSTAAGGGGADPEAGSPHLL